MVTLEGESAAVKVPWPSLLNMTMLLGNRPTARSSVPLLSKSMGPSAAVAVLLKQSPGPAKLPAPSLRNRRTGQTALIVFVLATISGAGLPVNCPTATRTIWKSEMKLLRSTNSPVPCLYR